MATRLPTSRLKRVDLPTLGLPTTATTGRAMRIVLRPAVRCGDVYQRGVSERNGVWSARQFFAAKLGERSVLFTFD